MHKLHGLGSQKSPKDKHHGVKVIRCAVASAVLHFHGGAASRERVMERLYTLPCKFTKRSLRVRDKKWVQKSDHQTSEKEPNNLGKPSKSRLYVMQRVLHIKLEASIIN